MPTYEYQCGTCKKRYDLRESFSAPSEHVCQKCGKGQAKRVLHAPRVVFKGKGFYATDSRATSTHTDETPDNKGDDSVKTPKAKKATSTESSTGTAAASDASTETAAS